VRWKAETQNRRAIGHGKGKNLEGWLRARGWFLLPSQEGSYLATHRRARLELWRDVCAGTPEELMALIGAQREAKTREKAERRGHIEGHLAALERSESKPRASQVRALAEISVEDTHRLLEQNECLWIDAPAPAPTSIRRSTALYFIPGDQRPINKWRLEFLQTMDVVAPQIWDELLALAKSLFR
jgi:hypothetical protein